VGEVLAKFGISGGVGFLLGLVAVWWIQPTTEGGTVLLIAIFVIASTVIGGIVSPFFGTREPSKRAVLVRKDRAVSQGRQRTGAGEQPMASIPPKVFICYSHADKKWLERLKRHLKPLVREGCLDCWDDTHIRPGDDWQEEIRTALDTAQAAVLLISADFFASDFIDEAELPPLLTAAQEKGVRVLPLILSASRFARDPNLARFQAVNSPDRPLNEMPEAEQEKVLERLAQTIESTLNQS
jgi:TIR domain